MVLDPPGKKYIVDDEGNPYTRIPEDAFPTNVDLDTIAYPPDGWVLRTVTIGYYEDHSMYIGIRYGEGVAYEVFVPGYEGWAVDLDWEEDTGNWSVEEAHDDFESGYDELDWTDVGERESFKKGVTLAFDHMAERSEDSR